MPVIEPTLKNMGSNLIWYALHATLAAAILFIGNPISIFIVLSSFAFVWAFVWYISICTLRIHCFQLKSWSISILFKFFIHRPLKNVPIYDICFGILTSPFRQYPDFYILGEQRCGTTALAHLLTTHLNKTIIGPKTPLSVPSTINKDTMYFRGFFGFLNIHLYKMFFPLKWNLSNNSNSNNYNIQKKLCFDACPSYLYLPYIRDLLYQVSLNKQKTENKNSKFIVLLRNPIERFKSNINREAFISNAIEPLGLTKSLNILNDLTLLNNNSNDNKRILNKTIEFNLSESFVQQYESLKTANCQPLVNSHNLSKLNEIAIIDRCSFVSRGFYDEHIEWYFKKFDKKNFCFLTTEQLKNDNVKHTLTKICKFLDIYDICQNSIDDIKDENCKSKQMNGHESIVKLDNQTYEHLKKIYQNHNNRLRDLIGIETMW